MASKSPPFKRANRAVRLGDMVGNALDPALKKRGFASRDLLAHWPAIAPAPYGEMAMPDRLVWPRRNAANAEGATLYLRCREGQAMALQHEGDKIAGAINRYYGYFLVSTVRLSAEAFVPEPPAQAAEAEPLTEGETAALSQTLAPIADDDLKAALSRLGEALLRKR